jgi:cation:H+ antiporter
MLVDVLLVAGGLAILLSGAWLVLRGAVAIALMYGLSRVVVGATVVAFGTSAPELVVSLTAAAGDSGGLAVGNVIGSNVANVALVLGLGAVLTPIAVHSRLLSWEIPALIVATLAVLLLGIDGGYARWEGFLLFGVGLVGFIVASIAIVPTPSVLAGETPGLPERAELPEDQPDRTANALALAGATLVLGLAGLTLGATLAVEGATGIAGRVGLSDLAIGVTIVAIGTSLPEIATTLVAAARREHEIAIANAVGSNIFNLLGVLGATALVAPLSIDRDLYQFEMLALAASSLVLIPLVRLHTRSLVDRLEGALLLGGYAAFLVVVLQRA